jgi:hypothetical protein
MLRSRLLAAAPLAVLFALPAPAAPAGPAPSLYEELPWDPVGATTPYSHFGIAVAPAGDVDHDGDGDVLVGAPGAGEDPHFNAGRVFLYEGSPQGLGDAPSWSWSPPQVDAYAGSALAPAGDVNGDGYHDVVVGVPGWNVGGAFGAGRVVLFHGGPTGLPATPSRELLPPTPQNGQQFGFSVATAGDINGDGYDDVLVGAPSYSDGQNAFRGRAYVYLGSASGLAATPARTWTGAPQNGRFGWSVSSAGDFNADGYSDILIAAPYEMNTLTEEGRVSLWFGAITGLADAPTSTIWGGSTQAFCGQSLSLAGDVNGDLFADVLIGLPSYHDATVARGKANLHFGNTTGLGAGTRVLDANDGQLDEFGLVVAALGDLDGDGFADFGVRGNHLPAGDGRIAIFAGGPLGFEPMGEILSGTLDGFAYSFATSGDVDGDGRAEVVAGRALADVQIDVEEGRAVLYRRTRVLPAPAPGWPISAAAWGGLAIVPAYSGGFAQLAVGEPSGAGDFGQVSLFTGVAEQGVIPSPSGAWTGAMEEEGFGARIVDAGDVNRDGLTDLVVAAPYHDGAGGFFARGQVRFIPGTTGFLSAPVTFLVGERSGDRVGLALAGRGDVNGDGFHDVLVGARECDSATKTDCGKAWLFLGAPGGPGVAAWTREGDVTGRGLGASVALGDVDADGYSDVLVGSSTPESGFPPLAGRVEVYYGGPAGLAATPGLVLTSRTPSVSFGEVVCALGDVTGDGICDLGVGSPRDGAGRVDLYAGTRGRSQSNIPWAKWLGAQDGARFGMALAGGGDVDGDGFGDFAIGEPWWDLSEAAPDVGRVHLVHGAAPLPEDVPGWTSPWGNTAGRLGEAIAPLADLSGDGFADIAIAMPGGRVDVHLGGGGVGRRHRLSLEEPTLTQAWRYHPARMQHDMAVTVGIDLVHPAGRARMTNQVELAVPNEPFTGVPTFSNTTLFTSGPSGSRVYSGIFAPWPSRAYKVRGRTISRSPYFQRSRWVTPDAHTTGDHDLWLSGTVVDVAEPVLEGPDTRLLAATPNPSAGATAARVSFVLASPGRVTLAVHDVRGARLATLADGATLPAGRHEIAWDGLDRHGRRAAAGIYFVTLEAPGVARGNDRMRIVRLP